MRKPEMDSQTPQIAVPEYLALSIRRVLRPLVKFFLSRGIGLQAVVELLKATYVEVAENDFPIQGRRQTDSRISLLTGVHRKDIRRLRYVNRDITDGPSRIISLSERLAALWTGSPTYTDEAGEPLPLARLASKGGKKSFEALVRAVSKDMRSRVLLDEWLRLGVAYQDEEDRVHLAKSAFVPEKGMEEKTYFFGHNVHDHIAAAVHNLNGIVPSFLERSVYYNELSEESVKELRRATEIHAMKALLTINKKALEMEKRDARSKGQRYRFNFGTYFFSEPMKSSSTQR
jgi:hypothetical protein